MYENQRKKEEDAADKSIVDALSTFGWIEENEEEQEIENEELNYLEQINLFKQQNLKLNNEIKKKSIEIEELRTEKTLFTSTKEKLLKEIKEIKSEITEKNDIIEELKARIKDEDESIEGHSIQELNEELDSKNHEIEKTHLKLDEQYEQIQELTSKIEKIESNEINKQELSEQLQEKDRKIKELSEQIQYLQNDTIHKSKYDKVQILIEKKDQIITEKEKRTFELQNSLNSSNLKIKNLMTQIETFSLVKKDLEKKEDRIKLLIIENEQLKQKDFSNKEIIDRTEKKLTEAIRAEGSMSGKYELELSKIQNLLNEKEVEIEKLKASQVDLKNKLHETELIEDKILTDFQAVKDENLKLESKLEKAELELVELKKRIKFMRRDIQKL